MPFTFSHPAFAVPLQRLCKNKLSLTGLVIGSIVPDVEYFIRFRHSSFYSHSWWGMFWFDLPIGLGLAFFYHHVLRNAFISHAPTVLRNRLVPYKNFKWDEWFEKNKLKVMLSILIGVMTHLVWDRLMHRSAGVISQISSTPTEVDFKGRDLRYYLLWNISSFGGLLLIAWFIWKLPANVTTKTKRTKSIYWLVLFCTALFLSFINYFVWNDKGVDNLAISFINGLFLGATFCSFFHENRYLPSVPIKIITSID